MEYRRVGKSGLKISAISLGSWITYGGSTEDDVAIATIRRALGLGCNHFDTADVYQGGRAEEILGRALDGVVRSDVVIATKVFWPTGNGPNDRGLSRKHVVESCERSLKRLQTDYVDILYCHRYDPEADLEETLRALDDLVRAGKVLYAGISEWPAFRIKEGTGLSRELGLHSLAVDQIQYNLLHRDPEREVIPACREAGMGVVAFSPLAQGLLTGKYRPGVQAPEGSRGAGNPRMVRAEALERVERLRPIADAAGIPLGQLALGWLLSRPGVTSALVGASSPAQIEENTKAADAALPADVLEAIGKA